MGNTSPPAPTLPLYSVIQQGYASTRVREAISANPSAAAVRSPDGRLPLHIAIDDGFKGYPSDIVIQLIKAYPDGAAVLSPDGRSPLLAASAASYSDQVASLLFRLHPAAAAIASHDGELPLHHAISRGFSSTLVCELIASYPGAAAAASQDGICPLLSACKASYPEHLVSLLLQLHPAAAWAHSPDGSLPLHYAISKCYSNRFVSKLIDLHPLGAAVMAPWRSYPLVDACRHKFSNHVVSRLLRANPAAAASASPVLALHYAITEGYSNATIRALIAAYPQGREIVPIGALDRLQTNVEVSTEQGCKDAALIYAYKRLLKIDASALAHARQEIAAARARNYGELRHLAQSRRLRQQVRPEIAQTRHRRGRARQAFARLAALVSAAPADTSVAAPAAVAFVVEPAAGAPPDSADASATAASVCVVCLDDVSTIAFIPCGHMCVCGHCAIAVQRNRQQALCPVCRAQSTGTMRIF